MADSLIITDEASRDRAASFVAAINPARKWEVVVKRWQKRRTISQNSQMWVWIDDAAKQCSDGESGYDKLAIHEMFKRRFLTPVSTFEHDGDVYGSYSTRGLTTREMSEYMEKIAAFCATELGVVLSAPPSLEDQRR